MRTHANLILRTVGILGAVLAVTSASAADEWAVRRSKDGHCIVQPITASVSEHPDLIKKYKDQKEACEGARKLKTQDEADTRKCQTYREASVSACQSKFKVELKR